MNIEHVEVAWLRIKDQAKRFWTEIAPRIPKVSKAADSRKLHIVQEKPDLRS